jgi:hypothetical protein
MKLNGYQRIGVVISCVWFVAVFTFFYTDLKTALNERDQSVELKIWTDQHPNENIFSFYDHDLAEIRLHFTAEQKAVSDKNTYALRFSSVCTQFLTILFVWLTPLLAGYLIYKIFNWIRDGFVSS